MIKNVNPYLENLFVTYDIALLLKDLGFDEECFGFFTYLGEIRRYTNHDGDLNEFQSVKNSKIKMGEKWCVAPLWSQVIDWFETEKHIIIDDNLYYSYNKQKWGISDINFPDYENDILTDFFDSKYEARKEVIMRGILKLKLDYENKNVGNC